MRHRRGKPEKAKSSLWLAFDITHIEQTLEIINSFQDYTMGLYQNLTTAFLYIKQSKQTGHPEGVPQIEKRQLFT